MDIALPDPFCLVLPNQLGLHGTLPFGWSVVTIAIREVT
jgi:hypothetical protein